jgi:GTP-binding protein|tara:strand:+ start:1351 stop:2316 length:966 start_codon:yes stop_codon:yes gene_type:complete
MFIDFTEVELVAGNGGKGAVHFRREKFVPKGGPDGGDGGRGGHISFKADANLHTLQDVRYRRNYKADDGGAGGGSRKAGKGGKDITVLVPVGTLIRKKDDHTVVADLIENGEEIIVCRGGMGGKGNIRFKTATNRAPRKAQPGLPGETGHYEIELKVLADVGLVGLPNAGKSTLLSRISAARPKIADYPFTTLEPNLGIVKYGDYSSFVMADIPGLIEGASDGKGLGHQFLKHIERNKILLYLIDGTDETPYQSFKTLENEILQFNPDLDVKPILICRTKSDIGNELVEEWKKFDQDILVISSISGDGLDKLISTLGKAVQ